MAGINSEKLFIDPNDEIPFIVEKLLSTESEYIVFVIPIGAHIFSSLISLKILFLETLEHDKIAVLVTEDDYGFAISQRAGFVVAKKVSQINTSIWEIALNKLMSFRKKKNKQWIETNLENKIVEPESAESVVQAALLEKNENNLVNDEQSSLESLDTEILLHEIKKRGLKVEPQKDSSFNTEHKPKDVDLDKTISLENSNQEQEIVSENTTKSESNKKAPKVITLKGIDIYVGDDVLEHEENDKMGDNLEINEEMAQSSIFAGKDVTNSFRSNKKGVGDVIKDSFRKKPRSPEDRETFSEGNSVFNKIVTNKIFLWTVGIILLLVGSTYIFLLTAVSVLVTIEVQSEQTLASQRITIDPSIDIVSATEFVLPAEVISDSNVSESRTAEASGTGKVGTTAKGFVYIINKSSDPVTLDEGTMFIHTATGNEYRLLNDTTISRGTEAEDGSIDPFRLDSIALEADEVGDEYNVTVTDGNLFEIEGFDDFSILQTKLEQSFEGGEAEDTLIVSSEDFNNLQEQVIPEIKQNAINNFKAQYSSRTDLRIIEESIMFVEDEITSFPEVGEEVDLENNGFTLNITGTVTALAVKEDDISLLVDEILSNQNIAVDNTIQEVNSVMFEEVTPQSNGIVTVKLSIDGTSSASIEEEDVVGAITGLVPEEAERILEENDVIVSAKVGYSPFFVPSFLRYVPNNSDQIEVRIR